jgi:hypothetical protein
MAAPQPSARFVRAVAAERAELERHRARLAHEARELRTALTRIEHGLAEIDERCELLDRLTGPAQGEREPAAERRDEAPEGAVLRGPAIRERAVEALLESGREALHYRRWFELVTGEGAMIAGKDPLAVFLTQITRSPVIRRGPRAGVYELDRAAPERLAKTLERLQRELARTATDRARRAHITAEIGRVEKALEEAARVLDDPSRFAVAPA